MKGYTVYSQIQQLKEQGFRKAAVARNIGINWRTVNRYWDMAVDEYEENSTNIRREALLDKYRETISENDGDIIHTYEFEKLRQDCKLSIYMCRGANPESKGEIESVVKYIKGNYLENRLYVDDSILSYGCLEWLERTGGVQD